MLPNITPSTGIPVDKAIASLINNGNHQAASEETKHTITTSLAALNSGIHAIRRLRIPPKLTPNRNLRHSLHHFKAAVLSVISMRPMTKSSEVLSSCPASYASEGKRIQILNETKLLHGSRSTTMRSTEEMQFDRLTAFASRVLKVSCCHTQMSPAFPSIHPLILQFRYLLPMYLSWILTDNGLSRELVLKQQIFIEIMPFVRILS